MAGVVGAGEVPPELLVGAGDGVELDEPDEGLEAPDVAAEEDVLAVLAPGSGVNGLREEPPC